MVLSRPPELVRPEPPITPPLAPRTTTLGLPERPWWADDERTGWEPSVPRRVALFTETFLPRVDGIVNTLCWTLKGLVAAGCEPLVVAPVGNTEEFLGVRVVGASSAQFPLYSEVRLAAIGPGIWRQLDEFRPDLIHLVGPVTNGLSGLLYAQARGLPVVSSFHTDLPRYSHHYSLGWLESGLWRALRAIHNRCAVTLCPSHTLIRQLRGHGFERLRYWSRGVDAEQFSPARRSATMRARLGGVDGTPLLLFVGRLAREKRVDQLVALLRGMPNARLAIVGDGPARAELEAQFGDLPVTFTGYLRGAELAAAYASSDLFVFPSDSEAFGNVVLEAMASGLPVVAAAAGGVLDLVAPEETGLLVAPGDAAELEVAVRRYLNDPELHRRHAAAARAAALARTWERQQQLLLRHYSSVMAARSPRAA